MEGNKKAGERKRGKREKAPRRKRKNWGNSRKACTMRGR